MLLQVGEIKMTIMPAGVVHSQLNVSSSESRHAVVTLNRPPSPARCAIIITTSSSNGTVELFPSYLAARRRRPKRLSVSGGHTQTSTGMGRIDKYIPDDKPETK